MLWLSAVLDEPRFREERSPTTIANYRYALARWSRAGVVRLRDLSVESARGFLDARMRAVSARSAGVEYAAMLAVVAYLEETGRAAPRLLADVRKLAPKQRKARQFTAPFLTREQVDAVCRVTRPLASFAVRLACLTGLRLSELLRLDWIDVDLRRKALTVRHGKTGGRRVMLVRPAVELLGPAARDSGLVVPTDRRSLQGWVREASRLSGIRVTMTLCRHTRAAWWTAAGVPLAIVAQQLGHSIETCARHYAGLSDSYDPVVERGAAG